MKIAVLMTCHNRREKTLACLASLMKQKLPKSIPQSDAQSHANGTNELINEGIVISMEVYLVDDGSTDGTAEAAREIMPDIHIIKGDGHLYWCGGMRLAWSCALENQPDYYLLLNDDTTLVDNTIDELLRLAPSPDASVIAVAPIADPDTGEIVFGGHIGFDPKPPFPHGQVVQCDNMNANCTLIPRAVYLKIGMLHGAYTHAMGDFDYGFMASRAGIKIIQAARVLGTCKPNPSTGTWRDRNLGRLERYKLLWSSKKGLPFSEWLEYCRRNYGRNWPIKAVSPTIRILLGR